MTAYRWARALMLFVPLVPLVPLVLLGCGGGSPEDGAGGRELVVFAAASLRDVLAEVAPRFEQDTGALLRLNFAGSNVLARQIEAAPGADVFLSADEVWVDHLARAERLIPDSRRIFLSNRLVVVGRRDSRVELDQLGDLAAADFRWLAVGDPRAVPAGRYARIALESVVLGSGKTLWDDLAPRVAPSADVRAALAMVEARDDVVGIVYRSDAASTRGVRVLLGIPPEQTPEIRYVAALVRGGRAELGRGFLERLATPEMAALFARFGFEAPATPETLRSNG